MLVVLQVPDEANARKIVDRFAALASLGGQHVRPVMIHGVEGKQIVLEGLSITVVVADGKLVLSNDETLVNQALGNGEKLAMDPVYEEALDTSGAPREMSSLVYLNLESAIPYVFDRLGAAASGSIGRRARQHRAAPLDGPLLEAGRRPDDHFGLLDDQVASRGMSSREFLFTSESVTEGHPDKIADQVSDSVLDAVLRDDVNGRVACETLITTGLVVVAGEISTETYVDVAHIVREKISEIGYTHSEWGFDATTCGVVVAIDEQSPDIAQGVDSSYEVQHDPGDDDPLDKLGAGDQGMMFGYATNETKELMPLPIMLAHKICKRLAEVRKAGDLPYLRPDGKAQVTVRYEVDEHGAQKPVELERILVSTQHSDGISSEDLIKPDIIDRVLRPILPGHLYDEKRLHERDFVYVNPTGKFVLGGPMGDTGLTGRKIIVDTYGGAARHGGGAFSGKDPTKVDRSAAYAARYVAKNLVAAGLADRCEVNVAYAIGVAHPVSVAVRTFGTEKVPVERMEELVTEHFDLRPGAIIRDLDLRRPIYSKTAAYGHFGRDDHDFTWERTDKAEALREAAGIGEPATA